MQVQALKGGEPNPVDTTGLCLLSLDGGGVRGLSTLCILKSIMDRLNRVRRESSLPHVKPCEVFDLIGGTSTGGLIAIMLGRLEMTVDECISAYIDLTKIIFEERSHTFPLGRTGKIKAQFDSGKLKDAIIEVIARHGSNATELFNDGLERGSRVKETSGVTRLRSYTLPEEPDIRATICDAALATSAATGFFDSVSIGPRVFVDGAFGANNPVDEVEGEASNIWCSDTGDLKPPVKCFISIGTGNPGKRAIEDNIFRFFSKTLVGIITETEETERKFIARWARHFDEKRFFRFNVEQGLQLVGLAEYQEQGLIEAATHEYVTHQNQRFRMRDCVQNLSQKQCGTETGFAEVVHNRIIRSINRQTAPRFDFCNIPFPRNAGFVGRNEQLDELEQQLFSETRQHTVAITGLGGVGKTQVAIEFAYRTRSRRPDWSIFWIPATNTESLQRAYLQIAQQLRLPGVEEEEADARQLVNDYLRGTRAGQWLLIFDNADDINMWFGNAARNIEPCSLRECLPRTTTGVIMFTTRFKTVASKLAMQNVVQVPEMDEENARELLRKRLSRQELLHDDKETILLLEQLSFLPLAIVQAASYINENCLEALSDYRSLLSEQEEEVVDLLSEEFNDDWRSHDIKNPVATTWLISFEQIQRAKPLAADILSFMACMEPANVPESLLPPAPSRKGWFEAIGILIAYSFVSRRYGEQSYDLHRLVHLATRNWLRKNQSLSYWTLTALRRLEKVFPDTEYANRSLWNAYLPHALRLLQRDEGQDLSTKYELLMKVMLCLVPGGRAREAIPLLEDMMTVQGRLLGEEHPQRLSAQHILAVAYHTDGQIQKAMEILGNTVAVRERRLTEGDSELLSSQHALAGVYLGDGQIKKAVELLEHVVAVREKKLPRESPVLICSQRELATVFCSQICKKQYQAWTITYTESLQKPILTMTINSSLT